MRIKYEVAYSNNDKVLGYFEDREIGEIFLDYHQNSFGSSLEIRERYPFDIGPQGYDKKTAERVNACVNACKGITTEDLEKCDNENYHLEIRSGAW